MEILIAILICGSRTHRMHLGHKQKFEKQHYGQERDWLIQCFFRHKKYLHENSLELSG